VRVICAFEVFDYSCSVPSIFEDNGYEGLVYFTYFDTESVMHSVRIARDGTIVQDVESW
jgi:hypothetical protein